MNVKKMLAAVSAGMLLLGLLPLSVPASAEETETVTETYNMDGFEKAPQSALDTLLKTESVALTAGITDDKYVADGAESAVKVAYLKDPENWGQVLLYAEDAEAETGKALPFALLPENMSEWETLRMYVYADNATGGMPTGPSLHLLNKWGMELASTQLEIWVESGDFSGWIELEPGDFKDTEGTALTAFPVDAWSFSIKFTGMYNEYDPYKPVDLYFSGLSLTREVEKPKPTLPEENPAREDEYAHTAADGFETATQQQLDTLIRSESMTLTAGVTDEQYVAKGAQSAVKISYNGQKGGWGQVLLYSADASGVKTLPFETLPQGLSAYDGLCFFVKATSETGLPNAVSFRFLDQYGMEIGTANIPVYSESGTYAEWVYLTPEDFGLEAFPDAWSYLWKVTNETGEEDGYKAFDLYVSGMSVYKEKAGGDDDQHPNKPTGVSLPVALPAAALVLSAGLLYICKRRISAR